MSLQISTAEGALLLPLLPLPLLLLLVLAAWQLWQARGAAVADLERQATQQAASLQLLARTVSEHVADLRWQAERTLAPGAAGSPDAALLQALQPRAATGAGVDGYALDAMPPLLHAGSAQWVWSRPEAPGADALAASQVLGRVAEVAHARHPELAGSRWVAWPERWVAGYPFEPSSALFERWKAGSAAELLARLMADEAFSAGRPQENPQRVTYWTGIRTPNMGEAPQIEHAAPVYDGDEFRGVVSTRIRLETIARAAAAALKGQAAAPWWVLSARGELLAAHEARSPAPTLQAADLASMRQAGGRAGGYGGLRAVAIDTPDAPWTLVVARTDAALLAQEHDAVHVAYHGTASHGAEIEWLHPVMAEVLARCPQAHFELFGDGRTAHAFLALPRVTLLHPLKWPNYLAYTAATRRDIGLSPLLPTPFNAARGAVKFYDFARMGAAGIYTDVTPFAGFVRGGVDGLLLPNEPARWIEAIAALVQDAPRRRAIAAAARARALAAAS